MSNFLTKLRTEQDGVWNTLLSDLVYQDDELGRVTAPVGFVTDFASLQGFKNVVLFVVYALLVNYGNRAAVIHDFLYTKGSSPVTRKQADALFYRALRADGVARWRACIFWFGVRIGGAKHFDNR